jgi:hypothetical protein
LPCRLQAAEANVCCFSIPIPPRRRWFSIRRGLRQSFLRGGGRPRRSPCAGS